MRYLADENLDENIVNGVHRRQPDVDFLTIPDTSRGIPDPLVLAFAAQEGRILVSHDKRTMPGHFSTFLASEWHSPGVFLFQQGGSLRDAIEMLVLIWQTTTSEEWVDHLEYLPWH